MAIPKNREQREHDKFLESSATADQVGVVVINPDGSNVGGSSSNLDRTTDNVGAALQTDAIMNDTTVLTPKFVAIDAASAGDNTILAAVSAKKIRVLSLFIVNGHTDTQTVRFESGAAGTALTGQMIFGANGGVSLPFNPVGWFETASNTLLNMELSGATTVDGALTYVEV